MQQTWCALDSSVSIQSLCHQRKRPNTARRSVVKAPVARSVLTTAAAPEEVAEAVALVAEAALAAVELDATVELGAELDELDELAEPEVDISAVALRVPQISF